jgi:hypothetical protein
VKIKLLLIIFSVAISLPSRAEVRWAYDKSPKFYRDVFEEPKIKKVLDSAEKNAFINKDGVAQLVPLAFYQLVKWLNKGFQRMDEPQFDAKKVKFYIHRDPEDKTKVKGRYLRQGNRLFCFPCLLKKNNQVAYGEFVRKDVFLVHDGEQPILLDRIEEKRAVQTRKVFKDKAKEFEMEVMKGEFQILSQRNEEGSLYHQLNCYYQLRLHYKGRKIPSLPQVSFTNKKTPMFISYIDDKGVVLFLDNQIQEYEFGDKIVENELTEYELTVPSEGAEPGQFWYSPGLSVAPSFSFLEKEKVIRLGEGKTVDEKKYYDKLDETIEDLIDRYRNDAYYNAREEYCEIIQTCFNLNNKSLLRLAEISQEMHARDCKGVISREELKAQNERTKAKNKQIMNSLKAEKAKSKKKSNKRKRK